MNAASGMGPPRQFPAKTAGTNRLAGNERTQDLKPYGHYGKSEPRRFRGPA